MSGRKSRDIGVERMIVGGAMVLVFVLAFLDDPPPVAAMMLLLFVDKLVVLIAVIAAAQYAAKRGPPKRWLNVWAILAVAGAWVAGGQLRDPIQKAGLFPMTNAAVVAQARDLSPAVEAQAAAWRPLVAQGLPLSPPRLTGRTDDAGRYVDGELKLMYAMASLSGGYTRQCRTALKPKIATQVLLTAPGRTAAHAALAACRDAALTARIEAQRLGGLLPGLADNFRSGALRSPVKDLLSTVWQAMQPDMLKIWDLEAQCNAVLDQQVAMLDAGGWRVADGQLVFNDPATDARFTALAGKIGALSAERRQAAQLAMEKGQQALAAKGISAPGGLPVMPAV